MNCKQNKGEIDKKENRNRNRSNYFWKDKISKGRRDKESCPKKGSNNKNKKDKENKDKKNKKNKKNKRRKNRKSKDNKRNV